MQKFLNIIEEFYKVTPEILVHAPFSDARNITPYAHFEPQLGYDIKQCTGRDVALFATHDKTETLGLIARCVDAKPQTLSIIWPNDWGGKGLTKHLSTLGLNAHFEIKAHARLALINDFTPLDPQSVQKLIVASEPKTVKNTALKAQAGLFSWRNTDPASALLEQHLPQNLSGNVADFGAGWGYLSRAILTQKDVQKLDSIELDIRGINCIKNNIDDTKLNPIWADVLNYQTTELYDFIVMNPPFHVDGSEDRSLGQRFIEQAAKNLRKNGTLYMVANRHLPYEFVLKKLYKSYDVLIDKNGYKVIKAIK